MPRYTATSCLLSVLIVALVGFVLHRPDPGSTPPAVNPLATSDPPPIPIRTPPEPTAGVAWAEPPRRTIVAASQPSLKQTLTSQAGYPARVPGRPFAEVRAGERLEDVARRVYGDERAAAALWEANRDQLRDRNGPLPAGTMLRTPR